MESTNDERVAKYGQTLVKASDDHWDYWARLTDGSIIAFCEAELDGEWVHLHPTEDEPAGARGDLQKMELLRITWKGRGISVPLSQIVWVVQADR